MKFLLFLLFAPVIAFSQKSQDVLNDTLPTKYGIPITLPDLNYNVKYSIYDSIGYSVKERTFIVQTDSLYRSIFQNADSLPNIDFSKYHLILSSICYQCLAFCRHELGYTSCHRNLCIFKDKWFIKEKEEKSM